MEPPKSLTLIIYLILTTSTTSESTDKKNAKISNCKPEKHKFASHLNGETQVDSYSVSMTSADDKNKNDFDDAILDFLKAQNGVRQRTGLSPFVWNAKLADYSAEYAAKRHGDCNMVHSYGPYGENIFWGSGNDWTPTEVVQLWVREHRYYDRKTNKCTSGKMCGHYTQIVWRNTRRLGCAKILCANGDTFATCNYDPPGNYEGEGPFDRNN